MWLREKARHGVFSPEELSELQEGFDLMCQDVGLTIADGEFAREQIASIILSLGSRGPCLDAAEIKQSALDLYRARILQR